MGKKVLAIVLSSILVCLNIISVEAKENYEEQSMTVTEDFIKQAEVEVSNQGYLKLTKINTCGKKSGNIIQKEAEVLVLVPEKEENLKKALKDIQGIKKGEISTTESKKFVKSINQSNNEVAVMSQGSGTKSNEIWGCAVALTISYDETVKNGRNAVLLRKVSSNIKNGNSVYVSKYTINYGCSGATQSQNYKTQNGSKSYGYVPATHSESKTITCPSTWAYVYEESYIATVGANMSVAVKKRSGQSTTSTTLSISNNLGF